MACARRGFAWQSVAGVRWMADVNSSAGLPSLARAVCLHMANQHCGTWFARGDWFGDDLPRALVQGARLLRIWRIVYRAVVTGNSAGSTPVARSLCRMVVKSFAGARIAHARACYRFGRGALCLSGVIKISENIPDGL